MKYLLTLEKCVHDADALSCKLEYELRILWLVATFWQVEFTPPYPFNMPLPSCDRGYYRGQT